jgi:purine nucleoside permease
VVNAAYQAHDCRPKAYIGCLDPEGGEVTALRLLVLASLWCCCAWVSAEPIKIKVVVVSMFEYGELIGDRPGEMQFWIERLPLPQSLWCGASRICPGMT